jgi:hypothetical protein
MTSDALIWDRMNTPPPPALAFLGVTDSVGIKWVKATDSKVGFAIELPKGFEFSPGKPYRILEFEVIKPDISTDKSFFCVFCNDPGSFEIFEDLCLSLIKGLKGIEDPLARAKTTIIRAQAWSELFKSGKRELTREQILGLICELQFMINTWLPLNRDVDTWFGPDRKSQDFIDLGANVAVEIKHMDSSNSVSISSIYQLQFDGKLFLCAYQLKEDPNGKSLNDLVDQIFEQLEPISQAEFQSKLIRVNYEKRSTYDERFSISGEAVYEVANQFPRIIPGTLHGLVKASYTLELDSSFDEFLAELAEIGEAIER